MRSKSNAVMGLIGRGERERSERERVERGEAGMKEEREGLEERSTRKIKAQGS